MSSCDSVDGGELVFQELYEAQELAAWLYYAKNVSEIPRLLLWLVKNFDRGDVLDECIHLWEIIRKGEPPIGEWAKGE